MSFDLERFVAEPSQEVLEFTQKTDLLDLAKKYNLSEIKSFMRKQEIKNLLICYFVDKDIFGEDALSHIVETHSEIRLRELELQHKFELQKMQLEKERKERHLEKERVINTLGVLLSNLVPDLLELRF
jgi:hypothetical protein